MISKNLPETEDCLCFLLDPETAECFEGLYYGEPGELGNKLAIGALLSPEAECEPCGLVVFHVEDDVLSIEWVHVKEEGMEYKIARRMLNTLLQFASGIGIHEYAALVPEEQDWLVRLYRDYGFSFGSERYETIRTTLSSYHNRKEATEPVTALKDILPEELAAFTKKIKEKDLACPLPLPLNKRSYLPESTALLIDGEIHAILLLQKEEREGLPPRLTIPWVYSDEKQVTILMLLYSHTAYLLNANYPEETELTFALVEPRFKPVVSKLFRDYSSSYYFYGHR